MKINRRLTAEERHCIVRGYEKSGLNQKAYARKVGIGFSTLSLWRRQSKAGPTPRFLELGIARAGDVATAGYRLTLPGGIGFEIERGFEISEVRELLELMRELR